MNDRNLEIIINRYEKIKNYLEYECTIVADEAVRNRILLKTIKGERINVLFICHRPTVWNSLKTVYSAMSTDMMFDVSVLAIPNKKQLPELGSSHEVYESEGAEDFWENDNCINGYNYETREWIDPRTLNPDYVFYQQPYNVCLPYLYKSWIVSKYARICYVPYGYQIAGAGILESVYPLDFFKNVKYVFASDEYEVKAIKSCLSSDYFTHIIKTGNPRFDLFSFTPSPNKNSMYTVLWTPRWCTSENNCFFFEFKDELIEYCDMNDDFRLVFRPHPQAFLEWNATGELPEEKAILYKREYEKRHNATIDENKDYLKTFSEIDCFVTDMTSLMAEYIYTGKPVVYCHKTDCFTEAGREIAKGCYWVTNFEELRNALDMLKNGEDPLKSTRDRIIKEMFYRPKIGAGMTVKEFIKNDAMKGK